MNVIRSVFISDTHLGSRTAQTDFLLNFLKWVDKQRPENVYIVGDFIDGWKLKRSWYWNKDCNLIIRKVMSMIKHDTNVFYIPGNHDDFVRVFLDEVGEMSFAGLKVSDEIIHTCVNGEKILVVHGDKFDTAIKYAMKYTKFLCALGDWSYDFLIRTNRIVNLVRKKLRLEPWSFSRAIKHQFKNAVKFIGGFEDMLSNYAKEHNCVGVLCGHIHTPIIKDIGGIMYYNCGDWVESNTAIVEYTTGEFVIVSMKALDQYDQ